MNRFVLLLLAFLGIANQVVAVESEWAFRAGGEGNDKIRGIAAAEDGGIFVTGEISGETDFGDLKLSSAGKLDFVVAKVDKAGRVLWASRAGGPEIDRGYGVSPTGDGGCFVTGQFQSPTIQFGDIELSNAGDYDGFVARFDTAGKCVWADRFGGVKYDYGHGVATAPDGTVVVAGAIAGSGEIQSQPIGADAGRSAVLAKFSPDGKLRWARAATGPGASGHNVAVGAGGEIYLCGLVRGAVMWPDKHTTESKVQDICVARFDPDGALQWIKTCGGASDGLATSVAVDDVIGNVCIAGMFKATAQFGEVSFKSRGSHDFYMATLSADGDFLKAHRGGGVETDYALGAAAVPGGGFVVTGELTEEGEFGGQNHTCLGERDAYVARLNGDGSVKSFTLVGGVDHDLSYAIAATTDDAVVISGAFRNETQLGSSKLVAKKGNDIFVAKLR